jgi:hypothetical protein
MNTGNEKSAWVFAAKLFKKHSLLYRGMIFKTCDLPDICKLPDNILYSAFSTISILRILPT